MMPHLPIEWVHPPYQLFQNKQKKLQLPLTVHPSIQTLDTSLHTFTTLLHHCQTNTPTTQTNSNTFPYHSASSPSLRPFHPANRTSSLDCFASAASTILPSKSTHNTHSPSKSHLERTHQRLIHTHHCSRVIELSAIIRCGKHCNQVSVCEKLITEGKQPLTPQ